MEKKMDGKKEKKRKSKSKTITLIILIILIGIPLAWLKFRNTITQENIQQLMALSLADKIWIGGAILLFFIFLFILIKFKGNKKVVYGTIFIKNLWICFILPMMLGIIVLLGAIQQMYPVDNPAIESNFSFNNTNPTMTVIGNSLTKAISSVIMTFYNLGKRNPKTSMIIIALIGIIGLFVTKWNTDSDIEENKPLQEIINEISEKDYQDLEKWGKKLGKKKKRLKREMEKKK